MNMSYCRFHNTLYDLQDCYNALCDDSIESDDEKRKAQKLIELCQRIAEEFGEYEEE